MNIVGVCGRASSGKDTVANHLVKKHQFKHMLFAGPLKEFTQLIFGFTDMHLYGPSYHRDAYIRVNRLQVLERVEQHGHYWLQTLGHPEAYPLLEDAISYLYHFYVHDDLLNARIALQYLGTEFGRETMDPDVWVRAVLKQAKQCLTFNDYEGVVFSDVRFANEVAAIKQAGGRLIRLLRNSTLPVPGIRNHVSELEQSSIPIAMFDCVINNTGTLPELYRIVDTFLSCSHDHLPQLRHLASEDLYE